MVKKKNKELGLKMVEREREKKRREKEMGKWKKIKNIDDVALRSDMALTSDILLVQHVDFQPRQ